MKARLDITLDPSTLHFVFLKSRRYVEDAAWPRFTLLGQSLGSVYLAWEALSAIVPDLYIDTMGYAFTFHVAASIAGVPVGAYVHYPTISTDMLARVQERREGVTNSDAIANSATLSSGKLLYVYFTLTGCIANQSLSATTVYSCGCTRGRSVAPRSSWRTLLGQRATLTTS